MVGICTGLEKDYGDVQRRRSELDGLRCAARDRSRTASCVLPARARFRCTPVVSGLDLPLDRRRLALTHFFFRPSVCTVLETVEEADLVGMSFSRKAFCPGARCAPSWKRSAVTVTSRSPKAARTAISSELARGRSTAFYDPGLVDARSANSRRGGRQAEAELTTAQQEKASLAPGHSDTRLVEDARKSEEDKARGTEAQAAKDIAEIDGRLPRLEEEQARSRSRLSVRRSGTQSRWRGAI